VLDEFRVPYARGAGAPAHGWSCVVATVPSSGLYWPEPSTGRPLGRFTLATMPICGRVVREDEVAAVAAGLDGEWRPGVPILDARGARHSSIWRSPDGGTILPFDPDEVIANYRAERYRDVGATTGATPAGGLRWLYYRARPLLPRSLQISMRRAYTRVQARTPFPRWPAETALHDLCELVLAAAADVAGEPLPYLSPWPRGRTWSLVLSHDVETAAGRDAIASVRRVEEAVGLRSGWNFVPERYHVEDALVAELWLAGHEVGVHGLRHDGRDLESLRTLQRRLPDIRRWAERWGALGFRAPATHRVWDWMPMLGFEYDSSYPDTDPYEPMPGGCCSWLPFFNGQMVELPITLAQDHTAFHILRQGERLWRAKIELLRQRGGMALLLTHPEYLRDPELLRSYERIVQDYAADATAWHALPREISDWWRRRAATSLVSVDGAWRAAGPCERNAEIRFALPANRSTPTAS
jgi:peptidoglycan/xylan/chitin deacetylase (PgdA/CDA1 family)